MATVKWLGKSAKVAQVTTIQITAFDAATTYSLTINDKDISVAGDTDADTTAASLVTAWNASTEPEHEECTASSSTDTVTLTADTAGTPFTVTASASGGTGSIGSPSTTTANKSPNDYNDGDNWSGGSVPVTGDDIIFENADEDRSVLWGLDQSSVRPDSVTKRASFTGTIGLPDVNASGSSDYYEYRDTDLTFGGSAGAITINIGEGEGSGSGRIRLDTGGHNVTGTVHSTGTGLDDDTEAFRWKGSGTNNWDVVEGEMGIAVAAGETASVARLATRPGAAVRVGTGVTFTTLDQNGGDVDCASNITTANKNGGTLTVRRAATCGTLNEDAGETLWLSSGTITTARVGSTGVLDFTDNLAGATVTNAVQMHEGGALLDPNGVCTFSAGIKLNRCGVNDVTLEIGVDKTVTIS